MRHFSHTNSLSAFITRSRVRHAKKLAQKIGLCFNLEQILVIKMIMKYVLNA